MALTSKPNFPIASRAKRLASVIDMKGIRGNDRQTARTDMAIAMKTKIEGDETPLRIWLRISNDAATQRMHNARIMALFKR